MITVNYTYEQSVASLRALEGDVAALHNHIASAVENPAHWGSDRPLELVKELRIKQNAAAAIRGAIYSKHGYNHRIGHPVETIDA